MTTYYIRYERITRTFVKKVPCQACGKSTRRQRTIGQTQNPWNLNDQGEPATYDEIVAKIKAEGAKWQEQPETCGKCREAAA
ncbi:MAG: hypothetical protein ACRDT8_00120 [Micromonosporaceae bacterium]